MTIGIRIGAGLANPNSPASYPFDFTMASIVGTVSLDITTKGLSSVLYWGDGSATGLIYGFQTVSHVYSGYSTANLRISNAQNITDIAHTNSNSQLVCGASAFPRSLITLSLTGSQLVSGNVSELPRNLDLLRLTGASTITGDVSGLPRTLTFLGIGGQNTLSGNIAGLPVACYHTWIDGLNVVTGKISDAPAPTQYIAIGGYNTLAGYTSRAWAATMDMIYMAPAAPGGLTSAEVDQMFIDLAAYATSWINNKQVWSKPQNAAPTATSQAARDTLTARGVTFIYA